MLTDKQVLEYLTASAAFASKKEEIVKEIDRVIRCVATFGGCKINDWHFTDLSDLSDYDVERGGNISVEYSAFGRNKKKHFDIKDWLEPISFDLLFKSNNEIISLLEKDFAEKEILEVERKKKLKDKTVQSKKTVKLKLDCLFTPEERRILGLKILGTKT